MYVHVSPGTYKIYRTRKQRRAKSDSFFLYELSDFALLFTQGRPRPESSVGALRFDSTMFISAAKEITFGQTFFVKWHIFLLISDIHGLSY